MRERSRRSAMLATCSLALCLGALPLPSAGAELPSADDILAETGVRGGLVVHLACGRGELVAALAKRKGLLVHGLDADASDVARARELIRADGSYGAASVMHWTEPHLPYADGLVNLCVAEDLGETPADELTRVLCPGGVAYTRRDGRWQKRVKPWPNDVDEWTHWLHGPDGNAVARDRVVGPPRHLQWMARPLWARLHDAPSSTSAIVSARGRVFYIVDEGPAGTYAKLEDKWSLVARDAFNGTLLWRRPMPAWGWKQWTSNWHARNNQPFQLPKRLVAVGEVVYVTLAYNGPLTALDAATGELLRIYEGTEHTDEIIVHDGLLVLSLNRTPHRPAADDREPLGKRVAALEADTGRLRWSRGDYVGLRAKTDSMEPAGRLELAAGNGRVFLSDSDALVALDIQSGEELWRAARSVGPKLRANFNTRMWELCVLVYSDDVVLFAQPEGTIAFHTVPGTLYAYGAKDGRLLWKTRYGGWVHNTQPNVFVIDGVVWIHEHHDIAQTKPPASVQDKLDYAVLGLELTTGKEKRRFSTRKTFNVGHHHRCYRNKATERFLLTSRRGVEFLDTATGDNHLHHWVRGDCHLGVMPCNGLLYATPHPCDCYIDTKLNGFYCLAPARAVRGEAEPGRVVRGPAWNASAPAIGPGASAASPKGDDWPTFRADATRSGSSKTRVPTSLDQCWETAVGARLGPPTVAGGKVYVPDVDAHRIVALDATTGKPVWEFVAGARVDTAPTVFEGLALFGSADGRVYCLRCSDGRLVWSRRVAPRDRLVGAMGQLESSWPVPGSVLVKDGVAYLAAGRSSYLDGGIHLYALRPATGEVVEHRVVYSPDAKTGEMPSGTSKTIPGMLADILVSDGAAVHMRREVVFGKDGRSSGYVFATGGFRDDTWFNRTTWGIGPVRHAQLVAFDEQYAYGIEAFQSVSRARPFTPAGKGYRLFATALASRKAETPPGRKGRGAIRKRGGRRKGGRANKWSKYVPVRGTAMALAGEVLFVAGAPDVVDPGDPLGAFEGRKGALLCSFATADGRQIGRRELGSLPVWDGMAVAGGRLYLTTQSGRLTCMGRR